MTEQLTRPLAGQISSWIQAQVRQAGAEGVVLGLSGGIDSAVAAAVAKIACGDDVLGLLMPCHSSPDAAADAMIVARKIGLRTATVDLTATYDALVAQIPHNNGIELANVPPRLRMTALYCTAQARGYLVVGTSNKTETLIGYFTKWGDGAADLRPIGGLYKHQVRELAAEMGIPEAITRKPPTADLWPGQTDENEIGMTYDELDRVLEAIETGRHGDCSAQQVEQVKRMIARTQHKRAPVPTFEPE